jgi:hypothetical protein
MAHQNSPISRDMLYGAQVLCTMKSGISCILSHCAVTSLTPVPCNASICYALSLAVDWLIFNHRTRTQDRFPSYSLISPLPYQLQTTLPPTQSSTRMDNRLCYIFAHVHAALDPLHHHSHRTSHSPSTSIFFVFWISWNLQDHSGYYSHHVGHSFAVVGQISSALHLLEYEGAEFESDIRTEMKRHKEDEARRRLSNK